MTDARLRQTLADYARRMHARGWVANHDGNVTARLGDGRYLATPTATSKAEVGGDTLLVVDEGGAKVSGPGRPFSEIGLHLTVFRHRPDVMVVIHAHPPTATGFAVANLGLDRPLLPEAVVSLGPTVPLVPFAQPGAAACKALEPYVAGHDAVLLANHGVLSWGADAEQAYLRLELVEHLARIELVARQLGGAVGVPAEAMPALLEARRKAGLGAAASATSTVWTPPATASGNPGDAAPKKRAVVACAPPPPDSDVVLVPTKKPPPADDLAAIIRQEIAAALRR